MPTLRDVVTKKRVPPETSDKAAWDFLFKPWREPRDPEPLGVDAEKLVRFDAEQHKDAKDFFLFVGDAYKSKEGTWDGIQKAPHVTYEFAAAHPDMYLLVVSE